MNTERASKREVGLIQRGHDRGEEMNGREKYIAEEYERDLRGKGEKWRKDVRDIRTEDGGKIDKSKEK